MRSLRVFIVTMRLICAILVLAIFLLLYDSNFVVQTSFNKGDWTTNYRYAWGVSTRQRMLQSVLDSVEMNKLKEEQIEAMLGEPDRLEFRDDTKKLHYYLGPQRGLHVIWFDEYLVFTIGNRGTTVSIIAR